MFELPASLRKEIDDEVRAAFVRSPIVNVSEIAARLQRRYWSLNVAREDIECRTLESATFIGALIMFDGACEGLVVDSGIANGASAEH